MATHPALLSRNLIGWSSGRKAPSCPKDSAAKRNWNRMFDKISQILGKLRKVIKLGKMLSVKLVSDYFSENSRWVFWQFFENFGINRKPCENDFRPILWKNIFWELSANCRLMFIIFSFLITIIDRIARAVPWKTKPSLLCMDLASSVRTSKPRA